jgi:uncharacterized protein (TIGR02145 family)
MKNIVTLFALLLLAGLSTFSQVAVSTDGSAPSNSAMLDVKSSTKGFLPPRMTATQMYAISYPSAGLIVYNTTLSSLFWYDGNSWEIVTNRDGQDCGTISYGGQTYHFVVIGTQCWMTTNLNIGVAILGSQDQTNNSVIEKFCYDNLTNNCNVYGGLYQWAELVQYLNGATNTTSWSPIPTGNVQGICPSSTHLPDFVEWEILSTYLGGDNHAGGILKETGTVHWASPNTAASDSKGFMALPGGHSTLTSGFDGITLYGYFWSGSNWNSTNAHGRYLQYNSAGLDWNSFDKNYGFSCRCVRD